MATRTDESNDCPHEKAVASVDQWTQRACSQNVAWVVTRGTEARNARHSAVLPNRECLREPPRHQRLRAARPFRPRRAPRHSARVIVTG